MIREGNRSCIGESCHFFRAGVQQVVIWAAGEFRSAQSQM